MSIFGNQPLFGGQTSSLTTGGLTSQPGTNLTGTGSVFSGFGFGTPASTQSSGLFQSTLSKPAGSLFPGLGTTATQSASSFFPTFSTASQSGGLFAPQPTSGLTSTFKPFQTGSSSLFQPQSVQPFGTTNITQPVQQPASQQTSVDAFFASLCQPLLFNDERDKILARWNQLQAMWGTGVGYCSLGVAPYTAENTFARFKAIAYNLLPTSTDEDGLVCVYLSRPFSEVLTQRQGVQDTLFRLLGGRPNLQMIVEEIRPCAEQENCTEVIFKVMERQATGNLTNVPSSELSKYLSSPTVASQLQSQLCACKLSSEVRPSSNQLTAYLENPPAGFDKLFWQQAQTDNPYPDRTIPVPLIGFTELKRRKQDQVAFSQQQSTILKQIGEVVQQMKTGQLAISQKVSQLKRKQIEICHRVLNVLRRQEVHRRAGFTISAEEDSLRCGLERIWSEITSPRGLRIRFQDARAALSANTENMSTAEKENVAGVDNGSRITADPHYNWNLDPDAWAELKEYLTQRQTGIRELQHLITEMSDTLKIIEDGPASSAQSGNKQGLKPLSRATPSKVSFALSTRGH